MPTKPRSGPRGVSRSRFAATAAGAIYGYALEAGDLSRGALALLMNLASSTAERFDVRDVPLR